MFISSPFQDINFRHPNMPSSTMPPKKKRSSNFSDHELHSNFDAIDSIIPIGSGEWERVEVFHSVDFEDNGRTADSLKRKFRQLYLMKTPTGDPNMPETVRRAKEINMRIREKSLVCIDCNETEEEEEEEEGGGGGKMKRRTSRRKRRRSPGCCSWYWSNYIGFRSSSERRHKEIMAMMMMIINQNNRQLPLTSSSFRSSSRRSEGSEDEKRSSI